MKQRFGTHIPSVGKRRKPEPKQMLIECGPKEYLKYMKDDPVRPNLFEDNAVRFEGHFRVYADVERTGDEVKTCAIVCVVLTPFLPQSEQDLIEMSDGTYPLEVFNELQERLREEEGFSAGKILCPYSIWSYEKGAGRRLITNLLEATPVLHPDVEYVVTMSPLTEEAYKFHNRNGAKKVSTNKTTVNYQYDLEAEDVQIH